MEKKFTTYEADVKKAFEAFLVANGSVREKAKTHGEALIQLRTACDSAKQKFTEVVQRLCIPLSTCYHHIKLVQAWDQAKDMAKTMGIEFEVLGIGDIIDLVKPPKKPSSTPIDSPAAVASAAIADDAETFAQSPTTTQQESTASYPAPSRLSAKLQKLITEKLVQVIHAPKGRPVKVKVADAPILILPC